MRKSLAVYFPALVLGLFASLPRALAQSELPRDRAVYYNIRSNAQDPQSPVLISTGVFLTAQHRDGDEVGWYVKRISITQYDAEGRIVETWTEEFPEPTTSDPLWYVSHANPMTPTNAEFSKPPELSGRAVAQSPDSPTLEYYLVGKQQISPPNSPYPITSIVDYSFQKSDEPEPLDEDEDEPVDVPLGDDEPG